MIKGMALPILFFPSAILNSVSTLLIPEISEAVAKNQHFVVKNACERIFKLTLLVGLLFGSIFFTAGSEIGLLIYNDSDVGFLLKALSPIVPLMYLDSICDGVLKGLDQQNFTFRVSVGDSILRIILRSIFVPLTSINGFISIMYLSNILTFILNFFKLLKVTGAKIRIINEILFPLTLSVGVCSLSFSLLNKISTDLIFVSAYLLITVILFFGTLYYSGIISNTLR
jgi:stage V sporulation protein B